MSDKITIRICSFDKPSKSANKMINKESVRRVINSPQFKENLAKGRILSLMSHSERYSQMPENIPWEDFMLISPYLAGYGRRAWIDESKNAFMGEIELADNNNGHTIKDMLKKGFDVGTSMSVSATANDHEYIIEDILSLGDFTLRPDLDAKVVKVDFSQKNNKTKDGKQIITFSQKLNKDDIILNFDDTPTVYKSGVHREGYSQTNLQRPKQAIPMYPKTDVAKMTPVDNRLVDQEEDVVVTNLDCGVAGVNVENINPNFSKKKKIRRENNFSNDQVVIKKEETITIEKPEVSELEKSMGITPTTDTSVSIEEIHEGIPKDDQMTLQELAKFPNEMTATVQDAITSNYSVSKQNFRRDIMKAKKKTTNFSLKQYLDELNRRPYEVFQRRINEIIQLCRSKDQDFINKNVERMKSYFDSYMLTWINQTVSNPETEFNIMLGLRLQKFNIDSKKMRALNIAMKKMKQSIKSTGAITKPIQNELNTAFIGIENDIYKYIDDRIKGYGDNPNKTFFVKDEEK